MTEQDLRAEKRRKARMDFIDKLPPELRACVHEHGFTIVDAFLQAGVRKPKHINHIIARVRKGSREVGNLTGCQP